MVEDHIVLQLPRANYEENMQSPASQPSLPPKGSPTKRFIVIVDAIIKAPSCITRFPTLGVTCWKTSLFIFRLNEDRSASWVFLRLFTTSMSFLFSSSDRWASKSCSRRSWKSRRRWKSFGRLWWTHHAPACAALRTGGSLAWRIPFWWLVLEVLHLRRLVRYKGLELRLGIHLLLHGTANVDGGLHIFHHLLELVEHPQYHWRIRTLGWLSCWSYTRSVVHEGWAPPHSSHMPWGLPRDTGTWRLKNGHCFGDILGSRGSPMHLVTCIQWSSSLLGWSSTLDDRDDVLLLLHRDMSHWQIGTRAMARVIRGVSQIELGLVMQSPELMRAEVAAVIVEEMPLWERDPSNNRIM